MLWSIVSNLALRSSSTNREIQPRSDDKSRSFVTLMRAVSVLCYGLKPDWKSSHIAFFSKKDHSCDDTTFSNIFNRKGRFKDRYVTNSLFGVNLWFFNERLNNSQFEGFWGIS